VINRYKSIVDLYIARMVLGKCVQFLGKWGEIDGEIRTLILTGIIKCRNLPQPCGELS